MAKVRRNLSADEWMAEVRAWAERHPQRDRVADDSRESVYDEDDDRRIFREKLERTAG